MKRILLILAISLSACSKSEPELKSEISRLESKLRDTQRAYNDLSKETQQLFINKSELEHSVNVLRALDKGSVPLYFLKLSIKQERQGFDSLSLKKQFKDALNEFTVEIPVDQRYYNECIVGQPLIKSFRNGSMLFKLSTSETVIRVVGKRTEV